MRSTHIDFRWLIGADLANFISGATTPPAAGTGANGDYYLCTATGLIWGPKAAGAWPAAPITNQKWPVMARAIPLVFDGNTNVHTELNAALALHGYVSLQPGNLVEYGGQYEPNYQYGRPYRVDTTIKVPRYGQLLGLNSWITASNPWTGGDWKSLLSWDSSDGLAGIGGANGMRIQGIRLGGNRGSYASVDKIIGLHMGGDDGAGIHGWTHAACYIDDVSSQSCNYSFVIALPQYSRYCDLRAGSFVVGFYYLHSSDGSGLVDSPELTMFGAYSGTVGHLFRINGPSFPTWPTIVRGAWAKQVDTAFAVCWETAAAPNQQVQIMIDGGSTEFNTAGSGGESSTNAITCIDWTTTGETSEVVNIPKVEVWVQKFADMKFRDYTFQDAESQIVCLLAGDQASVSFEGTCTLPEQGTFGVRAQHQNAWCDFQDTMVSTGGIYENVRKWPRQLMYYRQADTSNATHGLVMSGFGMSTEKYDDLDTELNLTTFTNRVAPDFSASDGSVTVSTEADSGDSGDTVTTLSWPNPVSTHKAMTPYLNGGASPTSYSTAQWAVTTIELKNTESVDVQLMVFMRSASAYVVGCDPAQTAATVPEFITLWGGANARWQRISVVWCRSADLRLALQIQSPTAQTIKLRARRLSHVRHPHTRRAFLDRALERGLWR